MKKDRKTTAPSMTKAEAERVLDAFLSGYIELTHPDVELAGETLRKQAKTLVFPSFSQPENKIELRVITNMKEDSEPRQNFRVTLTKILKSLPERDRKVLEMRFGILDEHPKSLGEIAVQFNVTPERIRQIEAKALRKMRHPCRLRQQDRGPEDSGSK